jgi:hypothetical protein
MQTKISVILFFKYKNNLDHNNFSTTSIFIKAERDYNDKMTVFNILNKILGIYSVLIAVLGTFMNLSSIFICLRVKNNSTFVFLAFFSFYNIFTLWWWNLENFVTSYTSFDLLVWSGLSCKIGSFIQFSFLQISAWHLVKFCLHLIYCVFNLSFRYKLTENLGPHQRRTSFKSIRKALEDAVLQTEARGNGLSGTDYFFPLDQLTHSISLWI